MKVVCFDGEPPFHGDVLSAFAENWSYKTLVHMIWCFRTGGVLASSGMNVFYILLVQFAHSYLLANVRVL